MKVLESSNIELKVNLRNFWLHLPKEMLNYFEFRELI